MKARLPVVARTVSVLVLALMLCALPRSGAISASARLSATAADPVPNIWIDLYSQASTYNSQPVPVGAQIVAFDAVTGVQCGHFTVTTAGSYGIMPCYGDDGVYPGATLGHLLSFTIDGQPAATEAVSLNGEPVPSTTPVTWNQASSLWQVNLHGPAQPHLSLTKTATEVSFNAAGAVLAYTLTATNDGSVTLTGVSISDPQLPSLTCTPAQPAALPPAAVLTCTGAYVATQADLDAGGVTNTAAASGLFGATSVGATPASVTVPAVQSPHLSLTKSVAETSFRAVGETLHYTLVATNDGNVTLTSVSISDAKLPGLTCDPAQPVTLAPGDALTCTGTYAITQADVAAARVDNTATASGSGPQGQPADAQASASVAGPRILLVDDDLNASYQTYYAAALTALGRSFDTWTVAASGSPSAAALQQHLVVIWLTGNDRSTTLTATDQANLQTFLNAGGRLFLSGQDIGYDIRYDAFYPNYLHAYYITDDTDVTSLTGVDLMAGVNISIAGGDGANNQFRPSAIGLRTGSVGLYDYAGSRYTWGALRYEGAYRLVYFAFGFEGISTAANRTTVMGNALTWLEGKLNAAPTANPQAATLAEDTSVAITLTGSDPDGDPLTYAIAAQPSHGALSGATPNLTYTPAANYNGADSFTFTVSDGKATSSAATVSLTITPVNDPPVANAQTVTTPPNTAKVITLTGSDVDGDPLTYTVVTQPQYGTLTGSGASWTYTPAPGFTGSDSFTFQVHDGQVASATATVAITVAASDVVWLSLSGNANVGNLGAVYDEDIVSLDKATGLYAWVFDGSDVGITGDVDAFDVLDNGHILMSFEASQFVPGVGTVTDADIVEFTPTSLGPTTAGTFAWKFDASDVGLYGLEEDVDALYLMADGTLLVSTRGSFGVAGLSGVDADLIRFAPTSWGANTAGSWSWYFDGSDVGLTWGDEDVDGLWLDQAATPYPAIYLSTTGGFAVPGVAGQNEDIFVFQPTAVGSTTSGDYNPTLYLDGSQFGLSAYDVDGFDVRR